MQATAPPPEARDDRAADASGTWWMLLGLGLPGFVSAFLVTATVVVAAAAGDELSSSAPAWWWSVGAITLAFTGPYLWSAGVADRRGGRLPVLAGIAALGAGSLLAGTAQQTWWLVAGLAVVGLGAASSAAGTSAVLRSRLVGDELEVAHWSVGVAVVSGMLTGPIVGGLLADEVAWRLVYFVLLPLLAAAAWLIPVVVAPGRPAGPEPDDEGPPPPSGVPALLSTVALASLCVALVGASAPGVAAVRVLVPATLGSVAVVLLRRRRPDPRSDASTLPLTLGPGGRGVAIGSAALGWVVGSVLLPTGLVLQHVLGETATTVGIALTLFATGVAVGAGGAGATAVRRIAPVVVTLGLVVAAAGALVMSGWGDPTSAGVGAGLAICGVGAGAVAVSATRAATPGRGGLVVASVGRALVAATAAGATVGLATTTAVTKIAENDRIETFLADAGALPGGSMDELRGLLPSSPYSLAAIKRMAPEVAADVNEVARAALADAVTAALVLASGVGVAGAVVVVVVVTTRRRAPHP